MITEKALLNLLALEVYNGSWQPWTAELRNVSIQRGGQRRGTTNTVEVGTLACTLVNAGDPLAGGTLKPNQPIRVRTLDEPRGHWVPQPDIVIVPAYDIEHPVAMVYETEFPEITQVYEIPAGSSADQFETPLDGERWGTDFDSTYSLSADVSHAGTQSLKVEGDPVDEGVANVYRWFDAATYAVTAWLYTDMAGVSIDFYDIGAGPGSGDFRSELPVGIWTKVEYFAAHGGVMQIDAHSSSGAPVFYVDDVMASWGDHAVTLSAADLTGWSSSDEGHPSSSNTARSAPNSLVAYSSSSTALATREVTGLQIGMTYTLKAWAGGASDHVASVGIAGIGASSGATGSGNWMELSYTFTASATTHTIHLSAVRSSGTGFYMWDDVSLVRNAWTEHFPDEYGPAPDLWVVDPPIPGITLWTGLINDVDASYQLDKGKNELTTFVTVTAVDAVAAHSSITRHGAIVPGFETWAQRITRLAASAVTPVSVPIDNAPIVRYSI